MTTNMEQHAKEAALLTTLGGFPFLAGRMDRALIDAYLAALSEFSAEAVALACRRFSDCDVPGWDPSRPPSAAQIVQQARLFTNLAEYKERPRLVAVPIGKPLPDGMRTLGPLSVNFGHGNIDMSGMTPDEKEEVLRLGRRPDADGKQLVPHLKRVK